MIHFHKIAFFSKLGDSFLKTQKERFKLSQSTGSKGKLDIIACENTELRNYSEAGQKSSWHAGDQKNSPAGLKMNTAPWRVIILEQPAETQDLVGPEEVTTSFIIIRRSKDFKIDEHATCSLRKHCPFVTLA